MAQKDETMEVLPKNDVTAKMEAIKEEYDQVIQSINTYSQMLSNLQSRKIFLEGSFKALEELIVPTAAEPAGKPTLDDGSID